MNDEPSPLADFAGTARLFPLPNLVLFPHVMQPLHIFEPRYRQMTNDALEGDRLLALVLLRPGWEAHYTGKPAIHAVGCLGHIVAEQRLADGRFNLLLRGVTRVRIRDEIRDEQLYRSARVDILHEVAIADADSERKLRKRLNQVAKKWLPAQGAVFDQFRKLLKTGLPLGVLCDILTFAMSVDLEFKQELLEEIEVAQRVRRLLSYLKKHEPQVDATATAALSSGPAEDRKFPPEFSRN
jgi:Lon protease-like protein